MLNALSIDVEDYFHPTEVAACVPQEEWARQPGRVEEATRTCLRLLADAGVRGTFFVLGWVADRHPELTAEISAAGHEIGCHSYWHRLVYDLTPEEFREDTQRAVEAIERACGRRPRAYRAPSYSITAKSFWALDVLAELGFTHDSSIYPITHDRYGIPGFPRHAQRLQTAHGSLWEIPIATARLTARRVTPVGGGGYLRLLPYRYTAAGLRQINGEEGAPACVYFHPWELDPEQPQLARGWAARVRTYTGLRGMRRKVERLLEEFAFAPLREVYPVEQE
jgi:polysaccharide deacetylase family protein (PEP-CTERM system associated)